VTINVTTACCVVLYEVVVTTGLAGVLDAGRLIVTVDV